MFTGIIEVVKPVLLLETFDWSPAVVVEAFSTTTNDSPLLLRFSFLRASDST
jgi:hypothetical protein